MNIKEAKEQIRNAMISYFSKDEDGRYIIPPERQRPVFLMGPPGIGKTAIVSQIAEEMGVGVLSYSMTHHTRQSALGLPYIVHKEYNGREYEVSEYTMSEIISSVYEYMERTGLKEGILFLDEINCVSETLAPVMLQFLQYKVFGKHSVPEGWIVVTAGNPLEYNESAREFDIVTWDRLKRIDIEPDFNAWKEYAYAAEVTPSVITYLEIRQDNFYSIETTVDGKSFVTARGWDDLSSMIKLYEKNGLKVDLSLISQYIQDRRIAKDFAIYYNLFMKYRSDYQVRDILSGTEGEDVRRRALDAGFDERLSLLGLILDMLKGDVKDAVNLSDALDMVLPLLKEFKMKCDVCNPKEVMADITEKFSNGISEKKNAGILSGNDLRVSEKAQKILLSVSEKMDVKDAFKSAKGEFDTYVSQLKEKVETVKNEIENMYNFLDTFSASGEEILIVTTELTVNRYTKKFIGKFGSDEFYRRSQEMKLDERMF